MKLIFSISKKHTSILISFFFIFSYSSVAAISTQVQSISGQLLQNNPILNAPLAPISGGLNEKKNHSSEVKTNADNEANSGPRVRVKHINVVDVPTSTYKAIKLLTEQYNGKYLSLEELKAVAAEMTLLLQQHGERLSYAYIPYQKISDGTVTINVKTGHLESISLVRNESLIKNSIIKKYTENTLSSKNGIVQFEDELLILSDLPGIGEVSPYLSAGSEDGGSILNLDISSAPRIDGTLVFDNAGSISSGRDRIGTQVNINSPFGYGDRFQALAYVSPDFLQTNNDSRHGNTVISRVSYDAPIATHGARGGVSFSRVNYTLGGPVLYSLGNGFADVTSLYGSYPIIRSNYNNSIFGFSLDFKRMNDRFWSENNKRSSLLLTSQFTGDFSQSIFDMPGIVQYQLSNTIGHLKNSDDWNGLSTKGTFYKINYSLKYQQALYRRLIFNLMLNGQQASKNLDGAEKMPLGGPYAVRAYSNSAVSVDNGWIISPGFILPVPGVNGLNAELFYDYASGDIQKFYKGSKKVDIRGYGISLNYNLTPDVFVNTSYAWRDGHDALLQDQNKAMGWVTAGYRF